MANFLDLTTGLPALWAKIKSKFYTKAEVDAAIAGITTNLSGLADTNISNPADGQVLSYDSTTSKWVNTNTLTETRVNELIAAALAQYGDGDTATYGYNNASEVNY